MSQRKWFPHPLARVGVFTLQSGLCFTPLAYIQVTRPLARHIWCPSIDHFCHWNLLSWLLRLDSLLAFSPPHKLLQSFHTASAPWSSHPACGWLYLTSQVPCIYRPPWGGTLVSSRSRHGFSCLVGPPWCDISGTWDCGHPASKFSLSFPTWSYGTLYLNWYHWPIYKSQYPRSESSPDVLLGLLQSPSN